MARVPAKGVIHLALKEDGAVTAVVPPEQVAAFKEACRSLKLNCICDDEAISDGSASFEFGSDVELADVEQVVIEVGSK